MVQLEVLATVDELGMLYVNCSRLEITQSLFLISSSGFSLRSLLLSDRVYHLMFFGQGGKRRTKRRTMYLLLLLLPGENQLCFEAPVDPLLWIILPRADGCLCCGCMPVKQS